jgi:hypothetical protein
MSKSIRARDKRELKSQAYWDCPDWANGFLDACNMLDEMYSSSSTHPYLLGDCLLLKRGYLTKRQVRRNPKRVAQ